MYTVEIQHNIESAHRFFASTASPKCRNIHGHSWMITLVLKAPVLNEQGMVIEFGQIKKVWRQWLDENLDHALMLHDQDPMLSAIREIEPEARIFTFSGDPTTEHLAEYLYSQAQTLLSTLSLENSVIVQHIHVQETHVNAATYSTD